MDRSMSRVATLALSLMLLKVSGATIIPSYAAAFVNAHNVKRCMHGVPLMTWSAAVEATALTWAATCSGDHTNLTVRMNDWFGENLWGVSGMEPFPQGAVTLWYNEISMYDWSNPILQPGTGHLTQVIWRSSVNLGCAMCDRGAGWKWVVCQYNPPGNAPGNNEILPPIKSEAECIAEVLPNAYNCMDDPVGWTDSAGRTCATYAQQGYCQPDGMAGPNWNTAWGHAVNFARQGRDAFQACCACGGGHFASPSSSPSPPASPPPSPSLSPSPSPGPMVCVDSVSNWKDMYGFSCAYWVSRQFCTPTGTTGAGWQPDWGSPSLYPCQGQTALQACCGCGGGTWIPAPSPSASPSPVALPSPSPSPAVTPKPPPSASPSASPSPLPSTAGVKCAAEGGTCSCTGLVQYGVGTSWTAPRDVSGQVACNNNQFGDPRQGKVKACYCLSVVTTAANTATAAANDAATDSPAAAPADPTSSVWPWLALPFAILAVILALGAWFCLHRHRHAQRRAEIFLAVDDITAPPRLAPTTCASPKPMPMTALDEAPLSDDGYFSPVAPQVSPAPSPAQNLHGHSPPKYDCGSVISITIKMTHAANAFRISNHAPVPTDPYDV